jgi:hypothetical protein
MIYIKYNPSTDTAELHIDVVGNDRLDELLLEAESQDAVTIEFTPEHYSAHHPPAEGEHVAKKLKLVWVDSGKLDSLFTEDE